jgi:O-antigen/teichoic acid export membrane protein
MLVVIALGLGFYWLVGLLAAVNVGVTAASFVLSRSFWRANLRSLGTPGRRLTRSSVVVGLVSVIGLLHYRADAILISLLAPAKDVGIYMVAYRFVDQAFLLPGIFVGVMFPTLTRYAHTGDSRRDPLINQMFRLLLLAAVFVAVAIFTLAPPLVRVVAGPEFAAAVQPARILAASLFFLFVSPVFYNLLIAINRQRDLIAINLAALAVNVGLNLVLIPRFSYNGAAVATVLSEGLAFSGTFWLARKIAGVTIDLRFIARVFCAAALAALVVGVTLRMHTSPWLAFPLAELAFFLGAFGFRAVAPNELRAMLRRSHA